MKVSLTPYFTTYQGVLQAAPTGWQPVVLCIAFWVELPFPWAPCTCTCWPRHLGQGSRVSSWDVNLGCLPDSNRSHLCCHLDGRCYLYIRDCDVLSRDLWDGLCSLNPDGAWVCQQYGGGYPFHLSPANSVFIYRKVIIKRNKNFTIYWCVYGPLWGPDASPASRY